MERSKKMNIDRLVIMSNDHATKSEVPEPESGLIAGLLLPCSSSSLALR